MSLELNRLLADVAIVLPLVRGADADGLTSKRMSRSQCRGMVLALHSSLDTWVTTQRIAKLIGMDHRPGQSLAALRDALYSLELAGHLEHRVQHNGHLWRAK